jgi:hypothetical protein
MTEPPESGRDRLAQRSSEWGDKWAGDLADKPKRTIGKLIAYVVVGIILLSLCFGALGLALGWFNAGRDIVSPENVKAQFSGAYQKYTALQAQACTVLLYEKSEKGTTSNPGTDPTQLEGSPAQAAAARYNQIRAEYNAAFLNAFEAKHVGPGDLPKTAPGLEKMKKLVVKQGAC